MPVTVTPYSRAAWIAKLPQPQPTSSTRMPGCRSELARDELELGALGLLERLRAAREDRAAVGHRLVQEQREEVVADVVVVANRRGVALDAVQSRREDQLEARPARNAARRRGRRDRQAQAHTVGRRSAAGGSHSSTTTKRARRGRPPPASRRRRRGRGPACPGARRKCASAEGRRTKNVGASAAVAATALPSQKRTLKGREGNTRCKLAAEGALARISATAVRSHMGAQPLKVERPSVAERLVALAHRLAEARLRGAPLKGVALARCGGRCRRTPCPAPASRAGPARTASG